MLHADGTCERAVVGPDLARGQRLQLRIPGNSFHTARLLAPAPWVLGGSTEWPGVVPADVELRDAAALTARYPTIAADIRAFSEPVPR